jgi:opacity protein-like surface antigen
VRHSLAVLCFAVLALAPFSQAQSSGNVFFGYSYGNINLNHGSSIGMNGFEGTLEGKFAPLFGVVADISGHYGDKNNFPTSTTFVPVAASEYNFLFGPRLSFSAGRFRPFAHALVGAAHESVSGRHGIHYSASDTSFAFALGGGLDYHLWHPVGWRFQGDFLQTRFFGNTQNDFRFSTGIVLHF